MPRLLVTTHVANALFASTVLALLLGVFETPVPHRAFMLGVAIFILLSGLGGMLLSVVSGTSPPRSERAWLVATWACLLGGSLLLRLPVLGLLGIAAAACIPVARLVALGRRSRRGE